MKLKEYIESIGVKEFADKFGVTERAALAYKQGTRRPRPEVAQRIVKGSAVTWEGIYKPDRSELRAS
jgi:transcriptional regulator with XRE-family HTH domain